MKNQHRQPFLIHSWYVQEYKTLFFSYCGLFPLQLNSIHGGEEDGVKSLSIDSGQYTPKTVLLYKAYNTEQEELLLLLIAQAVHHDG